ncbi:hypothetical protein IMCC3135_29450 [Granulosicoccus antarcticus IMCC3135]|uniref:Uncharacterized protein n=2 Tax=Granulosicoccus TaxID=437504 RepID=A0A2Z2P3E1_9GAMM|nr:hypothetical protein IMCC3135_29450 [Granulosicoccus antarcticus IMCC3135]
MTSDPVSATAESASKAYLYDDGEYPNYADAGQSEPLYNPADLIS